jgi:hypothetical protein
MPKIAEVKLSSCGFKVADFQKNLNCGLAELQLRSNISLKVAELRLRKCFLQVAELRFRTQKKVARAHLCSLLKEKVDPQFSHFYCSGDNMKTHCYIICAFRMYRQLIYLYQEGGWQIYLQELIFHRCSKADTQIYSPL